MKSIPIRHIAPAQKDQPDDGRFNIHKVEDILAGKDLQHDLHRHNFFFILLLQKGEGIHEIDFTCHNIVGNSIFLIRPGQVHRLQLKAGATGYLMEFDAAFYHPTNKTSAQRLRKAGSKNFFHLDASRFEKLQVVFTNMYEEYTNKQADYKDAIRANLEICYIELIRQGDAPTSDDKNHNLYAQVRFEEFIALLEDHVTTHKQVAQYTGFMGLSSYQLNEITNTVVGKTASELIDEYIILEAKRLLLATSNQIKEVADHLGYEDVSYFIRFFKKHTGHTPESFRKNFE